MLGWVMVAAALAAGPEALSPPGTYPVRLTGGLGGLVGGPEGIAGDPSAGGYAVGRLLLSGGAFGFDGAAREGLASGDDRSVGALFFGARYTPPSGRVYARLGFAHNHETPADVLREEPLGAIFGTASGIRHRSGIELGTGINLPNPVPVPFGIAQERSSLGLDLSVAWMGDPKGPPLYAYLEMTGSLDVGRPR